MSNATFFAAAEPAAIRQSNNAATRSVIPFFLSVL